MGTSLVRLRSRKKFVSDEKANTGERTRRIPLWRIDHPS
jgi:hypothetical protein